MIASSPLRWASGLSLVAAVLVGGCDRPAPRDPAVLPAAARAEAEESDGAAEEKVRTAFEAYRQALLKRDGKVAADLVDSRTIIWYQEALDDALKATPEQLAGRDFLRRFTVLRLRLDFDRKQLEALDGRTLVVMAIDKEWISRSSVESLDTLHTVKITEGRMASATFPTAPKQPLFYFMKEGGGWKIALWKTFPVAELAMDQMIKQTGLTGEEFTIRTLDAVSADKVDQDVYNELLQGPRE